MSSEKVNLIVRGINFDSPFSLDNVVWVWISYFINEKDTQTRTLVEAPGVYSIVPSDKLPLQIIENPENENSKTFFNNISHDGVCNLPIKDFLELPVHPVNGISDATTKLAYSDLIRSVTDGEHTLLSFCCISNKTNAMPYEIVNRSSNQKIHLSTLPQQIKEEFSKLLYNKSSNHISSISSTDVMLIGSGISLPHQDTFYTDRVHKLPAALLSQCFKLWIFLDPNISKQRIKFLLSKFKLSPNVKCGNCPSSFRNCEICSNTKFSKCLHRCKSCRVQQHIQFFSLIKTFENELVFKTQWPGDDWMVHYGEVYHMVITFTSSSNTTKFSSSIGFTVATFEQIKKYVLYASPTIQGNSGVVKSISRNLFSKVVVSQTTKTAASKRQLETSIAGDDKKRKDDESIAKRKQTIAKRCSRGFQPKGAM